MQSVYQWEKTADYPAISWVLAAFPRILVRNPPPESGLSCPSHMHFQGQTIEIVFRRISRFRVAAAMRILIHHKRQGDEVGGAPIH